MTVSTEVNKNVYVGDGVTVSFAVSFPILDETHLAVEIKDVNGVITEKVIIADYTVNGTGNDTGRTNYSSGNVVFGTAPLSTDTITIKRSIPILQETDYVENDTFPAESHEEALDKLTMIAQQQGEESDRTLKIDSSVTGFNTTIPTPEAGKVLRYNDAADGFENVVVGDADGIFDLVDDPSPQLGGQLDVNGFAIGDGTRELIDFVEDPSAVNHIEVENEASGSGPTVRAAGDDTNIDLNLDSKGTGLIILNGTAGITGVLDEDDLVSDSATHVATQQSVKAYVDASGVSAASQAEQEAGTEAGKYVAPATQQYHQSASKAWVHFTGTGSVSISASYNVTSITDNGTGDYTVNFTSPLSSVNYSAVATAYAFNATMTTTLNYTASSVDVRVVSGAGSGSGISFILSDASDVSVAVFGDL